MHRWLKRCIEAFRSLARLSSMVFAALLNGGFEVSGQSLRRHPLGTVASDRVAMSLVRGSDNQSQVKVPDVLLQLCTPFLNAGIRRLTVFRVVNRNVLGNGFLTGRLALAVSVKDNASLEALVSTVVRQFFHQLLPSNRQGLAIAQA